MRRILVDSDVILDLFLDREPHHSVALRFFSHLQVRNAFIRGYLSPVAIANVAYILTKARSQDYAVQKLGGIRRLLDVALVNQPIIDSAIREPHKDFEDSIQYFCAVENKLESVITRNAGDYLSEYIKIITPEEFLAMEMAL